MWSSATDESVPFLSFFSFPSKNCVEYDGFELRNFRPEGPKTVRNLELTRGLQTLTGLTENRCARPPVISNYYFEWMKRCTVQRFSHQVVRQQNSGVVEDFILPYSAVCLRIQKWKNYWNRSTFAKVKIKVARFFYGPRCTIKRIIMLSNAVCGYVCTVTHLLQPLSYFRWSVPSSA